MALEKAYNMFSGSGSDAAGSGVMNSVDEKLKLALTQEPSTTLPPVSFTMADVSTRLTALEDAVAELKKKVSPEPPKSSVEFKDILPSGGGKRQRRVRRKTRRGTKKNRTRN